MEAYEVLGTIGSGSFGTVQRIRRKSDSRTFAWKSIQYGGMSDKEKQMLVSEVNIMREFRQPNIVRYYDRIIDRTKKMIYIVMEYCDNGDLATLIKKNKRTGRHVDEENIWRILSQILLALKECHCRTGGKVLHRDIKPGNILLDTNNNVKLADFGLARILSKSTKYAHTNVGTPYYMSPEQVNERAYNEKSDIWSLGCLIYELVTNCPPFEASNQIALGMKIRAGHIRDLPSSRASSELNRIVHWMLQVSQSRRPSVEDLLRQPQVVLCLREKQLAEQSLVLKKKEEELQTLEASLKEREEAVRRKEVLLGIEKPRPSLQPLHENTNTVL